MNHHFKIRSLCLAATCAALTLQAAPVKGWLYWRGPLQHGVSKETQLPSNLKVDGEHHLWTADISGQSSPVIADGRLYVMGYDGEGPDLRELVACFDVNTGKRLWDHRFNDFMSDIIYTRYSTSNPTVDPETGNVYIQGSQGIIAGFTRDGKLLWQHSMMEKYGRMTFPNGRTASPVVDGELVITHHITANWGANGPARDRYYAFDKKTGELVWYTTPGGAPKDSSYAPLVLTWWNGMRVFYSCTGDGSLVCVNARTGDALWYVKLSQGGINVAPLVHNGDKVIVIHGKENLDTSETGRMSALRIPKSLPDGPRPHVFEPKDLEIWRNPLSSFSASGILVGDTVYQVTETGHLTAVEAATGKIAWSHQLGIEQRNASIVHADGKLYIPMLEDPGAEGGEAGTRGAFYVIQPGKDGCEVLSHLSLEGKCFGSPAIYNGKIAVMTTKKLYCFGTKGDSKGVAPEEPAVSWPKPGPAAQLQIIPSEILLKPGEAVSFRVRKLDANGFTVEEVKDVSGLQWESFIPPTAKVKVRMNASFDKGRIIADKQNEPSAGAFKAKLDGLEGTIRGRVLASIPFTEDLESFELTEKHPEGHVDAGVQYSYPPLPWIGARFKFEVRDWEGNKALAKTIDNKLFQRAVVFMGSPEMKNYTVEADVMTDGNRRKMSEVGLVNQRYIIILKGNAQQIEVNSNLERIKVSKSFPVRPKTWYRLKTRVDVAADGSGVVRAKAWPKGEAEPAEWTIEVPHKVAHAEGAPGLFGFAPQEMPVYIDNISVTPN